MRINAVHDEFVLGQSLQLRLHPRSGGKYNFPVKGDLSVYGEMCS